MIGVTPSQLLANHIKCATYVYGEDYQNNPTYITSQFKYMFETQYLKLLSLFN